jgi:hypothetical protein
MKGKVWAPIIVKPRYVRLRGAADNEIKGVVHVKGDKKEPLVAKLASVSIPDKVEVKLSETEKGRTYELEVKNKVKGEATRETRDSYPYYRRHQRASGSEAQDFKLWPYVSEAPGPVEGWSQGPDTFGRCNFE